MSESNIYMRVGVSLAAFGDSMLEVADTFRAMKGAPPATKGLGYWQRRERRAIEAASLRGRLSRLRSGAYDLATEVGRRLVNARRALAGEWSSDE